MPALRLSSIANRKALLILPGLALFTAVILLVYPFWATTSNSKLYFALTLDLCFTVPIIYLLVSGKTKTPKIFAVPLFVIGTLLSTYFIPAENQGTLQLITTWFLPLLELTIVTIVIRKIILLRRNLKSNNTLEFQDAFKQAAVGILPQKVVKVFAFEAAVFYYALFAWKSPVKTENDFSYHKESGIVALLGVLILAIGVETIAFHFLLNMWKPWAAWVLTILSLYTGLQVFAAIKSFRYNPIILTDQYLTLKNGILGSVEIPLDAIIEVNKIENDLDPEYKGKKFSFVYQNTCIKLKHELTVYGFYGMQSKASELAFYLDDFDAFQNSIKPYLSTKND